LKFGIYGAGSIGGLVGARLLEAGHDVHFIARGEHLEALQTRGLTVRSEVFGIQTYKVSATARAQDVGECDYVLLGVKAHRLSEIAPDAATLSGHNTDYISTQNGLPWWYFHTVEGSNAPLESVDPGGVIAQHISPERAIGSAVYVSCSLSEPGVISHLQGSRIPIGEPSGERTDRIKALSDALIGGGLKAPIRADIRLELWSKLMGNAVFNPLSALTRKTMIEMVESNESRALMATMMAEVRDVASAVGVHIAQSAEKRIEAARAVGRHKTSMLQDVERGRSTELDPILGSVIELAARHHVDVPASQAIYAAAKLLLSPS